MAQQKKYTDGNGRVFAVSIPLPIDLRGKDAWGTGVAWPPGVHRAKVLGISLETNKKGNLNAVVDMQNVCGPNEQTDYAGEKRLEYFTLKSDKGEEAANFFVGFLQQICPEGVKEANLVKNAEGQLLPHMKFFVGSVIEFTLDEEEYEGKKNTKMRRGSVRCIQATPAAKALQGGKDGTSESDEAAEAAAAFANPAD